MADRMLLQPSDLAQEGLSVLRVLRARLGEATVPHENPTAVVTHMSTVGLMVCASTPVMPALQTRRMPSCCCRGLNVEA